MDCSEFGNFVITLIYSNPIQFFLQPRVHEGQYEQLHKRGQELLIDKERHVIQTRATRHTL